MDKWFSIRPILSVESYLEIKLEDIVKNPRHILGKICDFIKFPWDESLLNIDLSKSHSGRWKREFQNEEKDKVNALLKDIIEKLGYEEH